MNVDQFFIHFRPNSHLLNATGNIYGDTGVVYNDVMPGGIGGPAGKVDLGAYTTYLDPTGKKQDAQFDKKFDRDEEICVTKLIHLLLFQSNIPTSQCWGVAVGATKGVPEGRSSTSCRTEDRPLPLKGDHRVSTVAEGVGKC